MLRIVGICRDQNYPVGYRLSTVRQQCVPRTHVIFTTWYEIGRLRYRTVASTGYSEQERSGRHEIQYWGKRKRIRQQFQLELYLDERQSQFRSHKMDSRTHSRRKTPDS